MVGFRLRTGFAGPSGRTGLVTVVKASIDLGAGPADRVQQLMRILANVLEDTDAGPDRVDRLEENADLLARLR